MKVVVAPNLSAGERNPECLEQRRQLSQVSHCQVRRAFPSRNISPPERRQRIVDPADPFGDPALCISIKPVVVVVPLLGFDERNLKCFR